MPLALSMNKKEKKTGVDRCIPIKKTNGELFYFKESNIYSYLSEIQVITDCGDIEGQ